ncbi:MULTISPECIES: Lrp/AsnC family transcriptional regulator [Streptomyces]|uniref:Lrp/AsnC family transcriptional regulator n=1 Tax=Streptomyces TaxID=1883 RepID=UPI00163B78F2|nr:MULTISPECIES: Lrp/AsnC family transcriptional regulator [Streptomyces]MBC2876413.1 Lrp/AsnC family transcriptional regulator [Streptomyces sp. TYQ1024]UBI35373.1 Lrp/AsnC family transcriptional regulator [Streptomyces mobaraensis]UKW27964.1 Lrp/AsnC family transcriptional regulator [Streptomyces sp. TYQ1024]
MSNKSKVDEVDRDILYHLQQDGRLTNVELARRVGLTPPPCLRRVKRLEEAGIITGYRARVDHEAAGRGLEVLVSIEVSVSDLKTLEGLESTIAAYEEVVEFRRAFGTPDYYLRVLVADYAAYEAFQTKKIIGIPGVARVISQPTMKKIKVID